MAQKQRSNLPSYDGYHKIFDRVYGIVERRFEFEVHENCLKAEQQWE
jgi:hypothetical protein